MRYSAITVLAVTAGLGLVGCSAWRPSASYRGTPASHSHDYGVPPRHNDEYDSTQDNYEQPGPAVPPAPHGADNQTPPATGISRVKSVGFCKKGDEVAACVDDSECVTEPFCRPVPCETDNCIPVEHGCCADDGCGSGHGSWKKPAFPCITRFKDKCGRLFKCRSKSTVCAESCCETYAEPLTSDRCPKGFTQGGYCPRTACSEPIECGDYAGLIRPDSCGDVYGSEYGHSRSVIPDRRPCLAESLRDPFLDDVCEEETELPVLSPVDSDEHGLPNITEPDPSDFPQPEVAPQNLPEPPIPVVPQSSTGGLVDPPEWRGPREKQMIQPRVKTISSTSESVKAVTYDPASPHIRPRGK
jgi:hypothetical protein